jgi:S-DNA-T family DNA segregation ATPase FtsK/SpoIIIE
VKARAAGIHLIFAAQRPDANVMPVQLRDNLGNRLILRVSSVGTSEIALGVRGAESLLGLGHLAARLEGEPGIIFAQAPFLPDDEIRVAVDAIVQTAAEAREPSPAE